MAPESSAAQEAVAAPGVRELPIDDPRWQRFVEARDDALPFHHPTWAKLVTESYGYRPFALVLTRAEDEIVAGLPVAEVRRGRRRWVSLPFTDECPPLVDDDIEESEFVLHLDRARRDAGVATFLVRGQLPETVAIPLVDAVIHTLELTPDADTVFKSFHRSQVQRNIRRAQREGIAVRRGESAADLTRTFYRLHLQTRHRLGVPVQPRRFFNELWWRILEPGLGRLLLAYSGTQPVAGAVFLSWQRSVTYKYGASDPAYWGLRPNHLLFWTAIREACESGYARFDFGRSDLADRGLREFKGGWGTREEPLVWSTLGAERSVRGHGRAVHAARAVLRRSPAWVCRAVGELLYRYAA